MVRRPEGAGDCSISDWLKCLDRQTEGWCAVEKNGRVLNDLIQNVPNNWGTICQQRFAPPFNVFNSGAQPNDDNKWLEELKCHSRWKAAIAAMWVNNNDGTASSQHATQIT